MGRGEEQPSILAQATGSNRGGGEDAFTNIQASAANARQVIQRAVATLLDADTSSMGNDEEDFVTAIESLNSPRVARWLERVLYLLPIQSRPEGYNPLGEKHLEPAWIARLGQTGKHCFDAIRRMDLNALGASMNQCMVCWEKILPRVLRHPTLSSDLTAILRAYQRHYPGAMYSGCGGGYLLIVSKEPVPGASQAAVRVADGPAG